MERNLIDSLSGFKRYYAACFQDLVRQRGLTQLEADILLFLRNNPDHNTARDIAELRGFAKSNVSTALERLRLSGYLTIRADPQNRRIRRIHLQKEREETVDALVCRQQRCFARMMEGFSPAELAELRQYLARMEENIQHGL